MTNLDLLWKIHLFSTLFMCGLIWFVQIVHYPLFDRVEKCSFPSFESSHATRTGSVVAPVMIAEFLTAISLLGFSASLKASPLFLFSVVLLALIWISTFIVQVPLHNKLQSGFTKPLHQRLVTTNWIRTLCWSGRGVCLLTLSPLGIF